METIKNLIFIDAAVSQPQTLLASLPGNSAYFLLDANRSGLEQIAEIAGRYSDLEAIHIVSHGSSGSLQLGNQTLNNTNLSERSALLEAVGRRLSPTGDILLYGCDLAANEQGQEFLRALATLTAADVAASINQTGGQGGDWVLESQTGLIESITIAAPQYSQALAANTGPSFAVGDGRFVWSLGSTNELVTSAEIDSSGRIVVAGSQGSSAMMARFNAGGSLDTTFGTGGILTNSAIGSFNDLAIQSDGIINAVGGSTSFYLGIYTADGSLSSALTSDISAGNDSASGVLLQTGKVILAGTASSATTSDFGVTRFTSTAVDTTFGATGKRTTDVSGADTAYASALQADGKIIVVGASISSVTSDISIARFTANGTIDNFATSAGASFGTNGRTTLSFGTGNDVARSVVVQSDGKILVAGYAQINSTGNFDFVVARYSALGVLDPTFGASLNGKVSIAVGSGEDQAFSMALQSDGKILLGGYSVNSAGNKDFALVRLTSAGVLDTTFSGGKVVTEIASGSNDVITSLNVQSDGKIVASGYASNGAQNDITLVRYNIDGSVDTTFNPINTLNATPTYLENGVAVVLDSDVMIYDAELVAGGNYAGASVQLSRSGGSNASDVFSALSGSTLGALVQGQDLTLAGTVVGSVTENSAGRLLLTFNAAATQALVNGVLQKIAYANSSDSPAASVTLEWVFSDGNTGDQGSGGASQVTGGSVVTITAVNDAPTLVAPTPIGFTDTSADDVFTVVSGTLAGSDPDNTNLVYGVTSGTDNGTVITKAGEFGVLVVTKSTGAYTYTPNDAAIEALLASSSESFTVTVTDGSLTTSQSLQINLSGAVDSPALQSISAFTYTDTSGDDTFSDTSGVLGLNGSSADALTYGITGGILQGAEVSKAGMYGTLFVHQSTGAYRFSPDDAAIESLKGNVSQTFSFTVTNGRDVQSTDWVLNFNGANDAPVFANPQAISYSDTATDDVFQTLTGNLPITDREGDALTFSLVGGVDGGSTASLTGTYGTLVLNKTTGAYSFIANQISIENTISNVSENFAVSLNDGVSTAQETFTVNVRGVNEAPSFGIGSGKLLTSVGSGNDIANGMWLLSDGRFFLAGQSSNGSNNDFALAKYNLDGTADSTFSFDGKTTDNNGTGDDIAQALAVQSDGKVLLVGSSTVGSSIDFSLIRYLSDGSLDTSFSGDGKATNTFGVTGTDIAYAVALQSDGKAVVAGVTNNGSNNDFALARYNTNGSLDTTFSGDGKHSFDFLSTGDVPYAVAIQSDGKILLAGQSISGTNSDFGIARVTTAGVLDTTFSGDGKQTTAVGSGEDVARSMLLQSDGKILVSGWSSNGSNFDFAMVRYNADGSLDTTFGTAGKVTTAVGSSNDKAYSMAVQADGKIILGGLASNGTNNDFALLRYSANGVIDTSFGTAGKVITAVGSGLDESYSLAIEADGKILVSGVSSNGSNTDFAAVRYNSDGSLDLTFNPVNTLDAAPSYSEQASGIVLDSDVQIYDQEAFVSGNFAGSSLTLSRQGGAQAEDVFSAKQGGSLQPLLAGGSLSVAGTVVGAVGKNAAGELILRFNSDATQVRVALVMQQITYENTSDAPASTVTIDWLFSDGNGGSSAGSAATVTGSTVITIASVNDVPVLQTPTPVAYTDTAANDVFSISTGQLPATDADNANLTYVIVGGTDNGSTISKVGTYGTLTVTKSTGAYTFAPNDAAIEARLTDATESFAVTASDGTATDSKNLVINITGASDAPVITTPAAASYTDTAADNTFSNTTGTLAITPANGETPVYGITGGTDNGSTISKVGTYGTFTVNETTGAYTFAPNDAAIEALKANTTETFTLTVSGSRDASVSSATYTVNLTGANDAPALATPSAIGFTDTSANDTFSNATGTLSATDRDGDSFTYSITNGTDNGSTISKVGTYGTLTVTKSTGAYTFAPNDAAIEARLTDATESFAVTASDGTATDSKNLVINITGASDAPVITTPAAASYTDTAADNTFSNTTGTLAITPANGETPVYGITGGTDNGSTISKVGTYGTFTVNETTGAYTFAPNDAAIEALKANTTETFTLTVSGSRDASVSSATYTVNLTGANDAPALATPSAIGFTDTSANDTFSNATGTLSATDRDGDSFTYSITNGTDNGSTISKVGTYGTLTVTKSTGAYTFAPNDAAIEARLTDATESFAVTASDGTATDSKNLVINITGASDAPVITTPAAASYTDTAADNTFSNTTGTLAITPANGETPVYGITGGTDNGSTISKVGTYGTFTVNETTGAYTFAPNDAAIEALKANTTETFTLTVSGSRDASVSSATYTVNLTGANDAPALATPSAIGFTDTSANDTFSNATGTLSATDRDGDSFTYSITNGTDNGSTISKVGTYGTLTVTKSTGAYTFAPNDAAIEARLTDATESFAVTASDGTATDSKNLVINITGASDAPVITTPAAASYTDTAADNTFSNTTGTLAITPANGETPVYGITGGTDNGSTISKVGTYGTFTVNETTGAYTFAPNDAAIEALKANTTETFTLTVSGSRDASVSSATYTVNLTGANDAPALATPSAIGFTDTSANDTFSNATGTLSATDRDGDSFTYSITNGTDNGSTISKVGTYGTLTVTKSTGAYTFAPNDAAIEARLTDATESFAVTASDGTATDSKNLVINITGASDAPVITTPAAASYTDTAADNTFSNTTGTQAITPANGETPVYGITGGTDNGSTISKVGTYGTFTVNETTGAYTFAPNDAAIEALKANTTETFTLTVSGSRDASVSSATYTVNLTGANDAPALATPSAIGFTDTSANDTFSNATGTLSATDRDGDSFTYSITNGTDNGSTISKVGTYGTLTVTKSTGAYTFAPNDAAIEARLTDATESFAVTASDGTATDSKNLVLNITGASDAPVITTPAAASYTDTAADNTFSNTTGTLAITPANGETPVYGITGGTDNGSTISKVGTYGTFTLNETTGAYTFAPNDAAIEALKANTTETFTLTVSGSRDASVSSATYTVNLTGANDAPLGAISFSGTPQVGQTLTASNSLSDAEGIGQISYQWLLDGQTIADQTAATLVVGAAMAGKNISVRAHYVDMAGSAEAVTSSAQAVLAQAGGTMTGTTGNDSLLGTSGADSIRGLAGKDTLNGGLGKDTLEGGLGNDTYFIADLEDTLTEAAAEGTDTVSSNITYTLGANFENLTLTGTAAINATGNELNNSLTGNAAVNLLTGGAGNDSLNGAAGADTLMGGLGNDTYFITDLQDTLTELAAQGIDTVSSTISYTLGANFENLTLTGTAAVNATGNELNNSLIGNSAANQLTGGAGNDSLNGAAGADTLMGGLGNDTYFITDLKDTLTEAAAEGTDTVSSTIAYTLGANFENLTLTGTAAINGTGNELNNSLTGNAAANQLTGGAGNDSLNGGAGVDTLIGGLGNDTYFITDLNDTLTEAVAEGTDTVSSNITYTLSANFENLTLTGTAAINATGNELNNSLTGNAAENQLTGGAGNDSLNGGAGVDTLIGGLGNDTYFITDLQDTLTELAAEGTDTVSSNITYTLSANFENLTLTGTAAINATGNELNNSLAGNAAANQLFGGAGDDILNGGAGTDTLTGGSGNDTFTFDALLSNTNGDVILDFTKDVDKISLVAIDAIASTTTNEAFTFIRTSAFTAGTAGTLRYQTTTYQGQNALLVQGEVTGDAQADFSIVVVGVSILVGRDFIL